MMKFGWSIVHFPVSSSLKNETGYIEDSLDPVSTSLKNETRCWSIVCCPMSSSLKKMKLGPV